MVSSGITNLNSAYGSKPMSFIKFIFAIFKSLSLFLRAFSFCLTKSSVSSSCHFKILPVFKANFAFLFNFCA